MMMMILRVRRFLLRGGLGGILLLAVLVGRGRNRIGLLGVCRGVVVLFLVPLLLVFGGLSFCVFFLSKWIFLVDGDCDKYSRQECLMLDA